MANDNGAVITDGSLDFSAGVNSLKVTTIQSQQNPNGLARNEMAWMDNCGVRDGGITQRTGMQPRVTIDIANGFYQGGFMYDPDSANPHLILSFGGRIIKVLCEEPYTVTDLSGGGALLNPADLTYSNFRQAENYLLIQPGDGTTDPLIYNGGTMRRSIGITNQAVAPGTPGVNEIPAATSMDYYMGRLWYAQGRTYSAGDIVGGASGTIGNRYRDAVLNVTENPLVLGGDGFTVPTNAGNIRALTHNANLDSTTGQGRLFIGTRRAVYSLQVPVSRANWIAADNNNQPLQTVVQLVNGPVNDRCIVPVNGDLYYQSLEPGIRSLMSAIRYFQQPGNIEISANEYRILQFNDRSLLSFASGIQFNNRLLQTALPKLTDKGVIHQALVPLDFVPVSSFGATLTPIWEGMWEGLDILQVFVGDFGGLERAFALIVSRDDGSIQLWEITDSDRFENGDNRVTWIMEFPAYTWGREFSLKRLVSSELWIDKLYGTVEFTMEYRVDGDPCWRFWHKWKKCSSKNSCEDVRNPVCYPLTPYRESYLATMTLPTPPKNCEVATGRQSDLGYQFQPRLTIKGWCRVRGILLHAYPELRKLWDGIVC